MMELGFFAFFATLAVVSALSVILQKNPIYCALSLIVLIASMGGLFLLQHATFLAVLQIVVYAGAIMALFLFVIMMVDVGDEKLQLQARSKLVLAVLWVMAIPVIWIIYHSLPAGEVLQSDFSVKELARQLFTTYVFPFEAIAMLIVSSVIGALYIARKEES